MASSYTGYIQNYVVQLYNLELTKVFKLIKFFSSLIWLCIVLFALHSCSASKPKTSVDRCVDRHVQTFIDLRKEVTFKDLDIFEKYCKERELQ